MGVDKVAKNLWADTALSKMKTREGELTDQMEVSESVRQCKTVLELEKSQLADQMKILTFSKI